MLALVDNQSQPKILSLRHILDEYLAFQEEIIVRRTKFDLKKARERAHLLEGLLIAAGQHRRGHPHHPRELRQREGKPHGALRPLRRAGAGHSATCGSSALQGLEREKLQNEYDELEKRIAYLPRAAGRPRKGQGRAARRADRHPRQVRRRAPAPKSRTSRTTSISRTSSRRSSACSRSRTAATSSACPSTTYTRAEARRQGRARSDAARRGLCGHRVHRLDARLHSLLYQPRPLLPQEGLPHPRGRSHRARREHRQLHSGGERRKGQRHAARA